MCRNEKKSGLFYDEKLLEVKSRKIIFFEICLDVSFV